MNSRISPLALMVATASAALTAQADVIFSEYIEGSSNNKALEVQNTGSAPVDLSQYRIELYSNGNTTVQNALNLSGTLAAGDVYVIANPSAAGAILNVADTTSSVTYFNGNDVLLLKSNDQVLDRIGQLGNGDTFGSNVTLVRKSDITSGDAAFDTPFDPTEQWDSYPSDTFDYLGNEDGGDDGDDGAGDMASCGDPVTLISEIQGDGDQTPVMGQNLAIEGIVIADLQAADEMRGFFIQEEDADQDANPLTSEALFVYHTDTDVAVGDRVVVNGTADEYYSLTQLNNVTHLDVCASNQVLPTTAAASMPFDTQTALEAVEGMRVTFSQQLTVNEVYQLGRYGEFTVSDGRRYIPTEVALPGPDAEAVAERNDRNKLLVEDGIRTQNPDPVIFPAPELGAYNSLRVGDTTTGLTGVINYAYGAYKLIPTETPVFEGSNPRTLAPEDSIDSDLRLASFNVLNYFNGDGLGGGFPTDRGADTPEELERQQTKLIAALAELDADVIGLMEIENDGFGPNSAIAQLVDALNATQAADDVYDYISTGGDSIGDDAIAVGLMYRPAKVAPVNAAQVLSSANSPLDDNGEPLFNDDKNRPALTQSFEERDSGERFTVVVNHLKSKGSSCEDLGDPTDPNGQGNCNGIRTDAAHALGQWLATHPTGVEDDDVLVMGDLNAYSMEDPIRAFAEYGYNSVKPAGEYSYVYDGESGNLDHALASDSLADKVVMVQDWHINTDEPLALDYNTEYKSDAQVESFYAPTPYRSSDHDPVILDLNLNAAPVADFHVFKLFFWYVFLSDSYDTDGTVVDQDWQVGPYSFSGDWGLLPKWSVKRNRVREATLTVTDDDGATAEVTQTLPR